MDGGLLEVIRRCAEHCLGVMAEKHMLERTEGDLEGVNSEPKRVKLEEQVTTVAIPQPKVTSSVQF